MALQKNKTLLNGVTGNYWKVISIECDRLALTLRCKISLFLSKDIADSNKASLGLVKSFLFQTTKDQLAGDITALSYILIKTDVNTVNKLTGKPKDNDLAGATDV